jgi:hypothetical protein
MDLREIGWGSVELTQLTQDRDRWWAVVKTVMNLRVLRRGVRHIAWLKCFTYRLVPVLAPKYKQHILSPAELSFVSVSQHADY